MNYVELIYRVLTFYIYYWILVSIGYILRALSLAGYCNREEYYLGYYYGLSAGT